MENEKTIDEMNKKKYDLIRKIDITTDLDVKEKLKIELRRLDDRIRYQTKQKIKKSSVTQPIEQKIQPLKKSSISIKQTIIENKDKMTAKQMAENFNFKLATVRWYLSKLK